MLFRKELKLKDVKNVYRFKYRITYYVYENFINPFFNQKLNIFLKNYFYKHFSLLFGREDVLYSINNRK